MFLISENVKDNPYEKKLRFKSKSLFSHPYQSPSGTYLPWLVTTNLDKFQKLISILDRSRNIDLDLDWSRLSRPPGLVRTLNHLKVNTVEAAY